MTSERCLLKAYHHNRTGGAKWQPIHCSIDQWTAYMMIDICLRSNVYN